MIRKIIQFFKDLRYSVSRSEQMLRELLSHARNQQVVIETLKASFVNIEIIRKSLAQIEHSVQSMEMEMIIARGGTPAKAVPMEEVDNKD